eukprot:4591587-Pyramimonas_sp.AAC.1
MARQSVASDCLQPFWHSESMLGPSIAFPDDLDADAGLAGDAAGAPAAGPVGPPAKRQRLGGAARQRAANVLPRLFWPVAATPVTSKTVREFWCLGVVEVSE